MGVIPRQRSRSQAAHCRPRLTPKPSATYSGTSVPVIKGNVESQTGDRLFHVPGDLLYSTTVVSEADGDTWFCTEEQAVTTGWTKSKH